jgi:hypothetical protein
VRRQKRRQRRWKQAYAQEHVLRGDGEFFGVLDSESSPCAGGAAHFRAGRRRVQLHGPVAAASPRHPGNGLLPEQLLAIYEKRYAGEHFVRLYQPGRVPDLRAVARTNFCDIGVTFDSRTGRAVVVSAIDNLVKGAAGQAVQNMNLALGFDETEGLL